MENHKLQLKDQKIAALLALAGVLLPGLHKFYLRQPRWGIAYLLLCWTPVPRIASVIEGVWYLLQAQGEFDRRFNVEFAGSVMPQSAPLFASGLVGQSVGQSVGQGLDPAQVPSIVEAVRQIEQLRQEGLISEYEFEQKRRQLLDRIG